VGAHQHTFCSHLNCVLSRNLDKILQKSPQRRGGFPINIAHVKLGENLWSRDLVIHQFGTSLLSALGIINNSLNLLWPTKFMKYWNAPSSDVVRPLSYKTKTTYFFKTKTDISFYPKILKHLYQAVISMGVGSCTFSNHLPGMGVWGRIPSRRMGDFWRFTTKIIHF